MKTLHVHSNGQWQEVVGSPGALDGYYTIVQTDAAIKASRDEGALDLDAVQNQVLFAVTETARQLQEKIDLKADQAATYTKVEVDGKFAPLSTTTLITTQLQAVFDSIYTRPEADDRYARKQDKEQPLLAKTVVSQAYGFGDTLLPPVALGYTDTGEGYGARLVLNVGLNNEFLVYKSDLEPLNALLPRIETLESKSAPAVDLSGYAKAVDVATTLMVYAKTADVAAFVEANYTPKATTYTKAEADGKFLTLVDVNGVYAFSAETYKKTETYTKAEVETRLLEVPSPMKYLQWGGAFQKMLAGNAKDKWFAAGLLPSIQIVKGKHYRLEMTTKFGPLNADYKECWVGFRFNYKAINELPCTKQPLVTMGGFGHTTVTRARAAIAATAVATTTPTRADRFRFLAVDDWASAEDIIEYAVEFEADQDIASANFVPEICFGGTWGQYPTNFEGVVAVFRQMD